MSEPMHGVDQAAPSLKEFFEACSDLWYEIGRQELDEFLEKIVELRRGLGGYKADVTVLIARPVCIDCAHSWISFFPELREKDCPDVSQVNWQMDLLMLGFDPAEVAAVEEAILEGIEAETRGPFCYGCHRPLPYWEDENCAFYVVSETLYEHIGRQFEADALSIGKSLKKAIVKIYGSSCFGCGKSLKASEVTMDHIVPKSLGGTADIFNLQPLCEACNQAKADQPPTQKGVTLHFPLKPLPGEAYEGAIW